MAFPLRDASALLSCTPTMSAETGRFDRHLRRVRDCYRRRRDTFVLVVAECMAHVTITGLDAGHHVLLQLPSGADERKIVTHAGAAGIAVRGSDDEALRNPLEPALVIGFGDVTTREIREGIGVLGQLVAATVA